MSSALPSEQKKWDTNSVPQSEVTWAGTPCLENTWSKNSFARSGLVTVSYVGTDIACFESRSITTRMAVKPVEGGSCSMKSIDLEFHGFSGTGSCWSRPEGLCRGGVAWGSAVHGWRASCTDGL